MTSTTAGQPAAGGAPAAGPSSAAEAGAWIAAAAAQLRAAQPTSPAPYLLLRGYRWGELRASGGSIDPKLLAAPSTEARTKLKGLLLDARWAELVAAGETVMATAFGRGWLDLQRYILTGLDGLGGDYEGVRAALHGQLRLLLRDLPDLPGLTLMDDSPTANAETLGWLRQEGLLEASEEDGEEAAPAVARRPAMRRDPWDIARERARGGDPRGAMELLMREANQEKSERARFLRRSQAAEIMVGAGMEPVALPILREMMERIETHRLEEWEDGETVAQPMGLLYQCITRLESDEADRRELYVRICRLDPVQAVRLGDDGPGPDEAA
jgi:type VI secretion system protein ImpA